MPSFQPMWVFRIHTVINMFWEKYDKTFQCKLSPDGEKNESQGVCWPVHSPAACDSGSRGRCENASSPFSASPAPTRKWVLQLAMWQDMLLKDQSLQDQYLFSLHLIYAPFENEKQKWWKMTGGQNRMNTSVILSEAQWTISLPGNRMKWV